MAQKTGGCVNNGCSCGPSCGCSSNCGCAAVAVAGGSHCHPASCPARRCPIFAPYFAHCHSETGHGDCPVMSATCCPARKCPLFAAHYGSRKGDCGCKSGYKCTCKGECRCGTCGCDMGERCTCGSVCNCAEVKKESGNEGEEEKPVNDE